MVTHCIRSFWIEKFRDRAGKGDIGQHRSGALDAQSTTRCVEALMALQRLYVLEFERTPAKRRRHPSEGTGAVGWLESVG